MGTIARSDGELVEASRRGEHEAFGHLVARYQDVVCAVSYSSTGDHGLSEDVAQETFIAAWRQLDRLRDTLRLRPWLCGIARNLGRKARKRRRREELVDTDDHVATSGNPFDAAARGEAEQVVREALTRVPETYREVLVLYYREHQSVREVAETLGTSEAAVMQRLSRGRRHLADSVTELVERSLRDRGRPRRDLVAGVLAAIVLIEIPSRVDASPMKGSTMLKPALAASAVVAAATTAYLVYSPRTEPGRDTAAPSHVATAPSPVLRYGGGQLGLAHAPSLGPTAAPRALASRSVAEADLGYLPADADAVIGVDLADLRQSALWKTLVEPRIADAMELREFEAMCGFDPLASLGSISIGVKGVGGDTDAAMAATVVIHGIDRVKMMSCFDKQGLADAEKEGARVSIEGDAVLVSFDDGAFHAALTFPDDTTALIVVGPDAATKEGVARVAAGEGTLATSSTLATTLQYVNTDAAIWLMMSDRAPMVRAINEEIAAKTAARLGTLYASLNVTDSLALDAGVHLGAPATVAGIVADLQSELDKLDKQAALGTYFDQLDVIADGSDLIVSLAIGGDKLVGLVQLVSMLASAEIVGGAAP